MGLFLEKRIPLIVSLIASVCFFIFNSITLCDISNLKEMLSAIINISAVIIGFLLTSVSILIALTGKRVIKRIQKNNSMGIFTSYFASPVALGFSLIVLCTVFIPIDKLSGYWSHTWVSILVFISCYFLFSSIRISILLLSILKNIAGEVDPPSNVETKEAVYKPNPDNVFKNRN